MTYCSVIIVIRGVTVSFEVVEELASPKSLDEYKICFVCVSETMKEPHLP